MSPAAAASLRVCQQATRTPIGIRLFRPAPLGGRSGGCRRPRFDRRGSTVALVAARADDGDIVSGPPKRETHPPDSPVCRNERFSTSISTLGNRGRPCTSLSCRIESSISLTPDTPRDSSISLARPRHSGAPRAHWSVSGRRECPCRCRRMLRLCLGSRRLAGSPRRFWVWRRRRRLLCR